MVIAKRILAERDLGEPLSQKENEESMEYSSVFNERYAAVPVSAARFLPNRSVRLLAFFMLRTEPNLYIKIDKKDIIKDLKIKEKSLTRSLKDLEDFNMIEKKVKKKCYTIHLIGDAALIKRGIRHTVQYIKIPESLVYNQIDHADFIIVSFLNGFTKLTKRLNDNTGQKLHRVTINDVAKACGYGEKTVYRVLLKLKELSEETTVYGLPNKMTKTAYEYFHKTEPPVSEQSSNQIAINDIPGGSQMLNNVSSANQLNILDQSDEISYNEDDLDSENSPETSDQLNSSKTSDEISYNEKGWTKPSDEISYNEKGSSDEISYNDKTVVKSTIAQDSAGPEGETSINVLVNAEEISGQFLERKEGSEEISGQFLEREDDFRVSFENAQSTSNAAVTRVSSSSSSTETSFKGIETSPSLFKLENIIYNKKNTSYSYMQNRRYAPLLQSKNSPPGQNLVNSKSGEILLDKEPCNTSVNLQQTTIDGLHNLVKDVDSIHSCNNNQLTTDNILPTNNSGDNIPVLTEGSVSSSNKHTSDDRLHNLAKDVDSIHSCNNNKHTSDNRQQTTIDGNNSPATYDSSPNLTKDRIRISAKDKRRMFYSRKINKDKLHNPSAYKPSIKRLTTFENLLLSKWNDSALKAHRQFTTSGRENKYFVESIKSIRSLQKGKLLVSSDLQSFFDRKFTNSDILQTFEKFFEYISCSDYGVTPGSLQYYKKLSISDFIFNSGKYTKTGPQSLFQQFYVRQLTYVTNVEDIFPAGTKRLIQLYTKDFKSGYGNVGAASSTDFTKASNKIFSMYPDYRDKLLFTTSAKNLRLIEMIDWLHQSILYRVKGIKDKIFISSRWYFSEKTFEDTYMRYLTDHNLFKYEATVCSKSSAPRRAPLRENRPIFDINNPDSWLSSQS